MLPDNDLYRAAGASAVVALIALVIAGITIALFFGGAGAFWGPVNDMFVVVTVLALILPILAVDRLAAEGGIGWMRVVTIAARPLRFSSTPPTPAPTFKTSAAATPSG